MELSPHSCLGCANEDVRVHTRYGTPAHGTWTIYHFCSAISTNAKPTPIAGLAMPLRRIIAMLMASSEGMPLYDGSYLKSIRKV